MSDWKSSFLGNRPSKLSEFDRTFNELSSKHNLGLSVTDDNQVEEDGEGGMACGGDAGAGGCGAPACPGPDGPPPGPGPMPPPPPPPPPRAGGIGGFPGIHTGLLRPLYYPWPTVAVPYPYGQKKTRRKKKKKKSKK